MNIQICLSEGDSDLEGFRPAKDDAEWDLIASGHWEKSSAEFVPATLLITNGGNGNWIVACVGHSEDLYCDLKKPHEKPDISYSDYTSNCLDLILKTRPFQDSKIIAVGSCDGENRDVKAIANKIYDAIISEKYDYFSPSIFGLLEVTDADPYDEVAEWYDFENPVGDIDFCGLGSMRQIVQTELNSALEAGTRLDPSVLECHLDSQMSSYLDMLEADYSEEERDDWWRTQVASLQCILEGGDASKLDI